MSKDQTLDLTTSIILVDTFYYLSSSHSYNKPLEHYSVQVSQLVSILFVILSHISKKNYYLFLLIFNLLNSLCKVQIYIKIDLCHTYYLVYITDSDEQKTAFRIYYESFEYIIINILYFTDICFIDNRCWSCVICQVYLSGKYISIVILLFQHLLYKPIFYSSYFSYNMLSQQ